MSNLYLDPNGKSITFREWKKRIPAEYKIYEHKTAKTITRLFAADIVMDANLIPEELHKRYRMESTNILTHDAMGEPFEEPKMVDDEFARKVFTTKAKAAKEFIDFCVKWCGGDREALESDLAKEVEVTKLPAIDLSARDMELKALSRRAATTAPAVVDDDDETGSGDDGDDGVKGADKVPDEPKAAPGTDKPATMIVDDIGSW